MIINQNPYNDEHCKAFIRSIIEARIDFIHRKGFSPRYLLMSPVLRTRLGIIAVQLDLIDFKTHAESVGSEVTQFCDMEVISREITDHTSFEFGW